MSIVDKAHMFAVGVYGGVGKKRRYTGEDYVTHTQFLCVRLLLGTEALSKCRLLHY